VAVVTGHVSRHGWIVRDSVESDDHWLCVDFFEDPAGGFGFEQFRSDPETGGWTPVSGYSALRFATIADATTRALTLIPWLGGAVAHRSARSPSAEM